MIAGQMADLKAENTAIDEKMLEYIHINKTAKMFRCAAMMGALTGSANESQLIKLGDFGLKIGLGFQVSDDILDVSSTSGKLGKTAGKDVKAGKMTYPALMGVEKSRQLEKRLAQQAIELLDGFGKEADILRELTNALVRRAK
jgi:geranylgeranyl diphosphate synthase type II